MENDKVAEITPHIIIAKNPFNPKKYAEKKEIKDKGTKNTSNIIENAVNIKKKLLLVPSCIWINSIKLSLLNIPTTNIK